MKKKTVQKRNFVAKDLLTSGKFSHKVVQNKKKKIPRKSKYKK